MSENIHFHQTHSPDVWQEVLVDMWDGQWVPMDRPCLHRHNKRDGVHQSTDVESEELVDGVRDFDLGNLCNGNGDVNFCQWFCNTVNFLYPVELRNVPVCISNLVCT